MIKQINYRLMDGWMDGTEQQIEYIKSEIDRYIDNT